MALNAKTLPSNSKFNFTPMDPGTYPGRLVAVIDLGLQNQRPFNGEEKPPAREIGLTYELTDEFMKDEDGQDMPDKPRWLTETLPFHNLDSDKARSTQRYKVFDPTLKDEGDWIKQINKPVNVTVIVNPGKGKNAGKVFENVGGIAAMRPKDADKLPALKNAPLVFDLDNPTAETWKRVPKFLQEKIKSNLEFDGSPLQKLLGKEPAPAKAETKQASAKKDEDEVVDGPPY